MIQRSRRQDRDQGFRTALVSMPFGSLDRPALGLGLLKSGLAERGLHCDVHYLFSGLVERIGIDTYRWLTDEVPYTSFAGDWCFTLPLYGRQPDLDWAYVRSILIDTWQLSRKDIARIIRVREMSPDYLAQCLTSIDWQSCHLVGFTSTFTQNLASLAMAQALRERFPHLQIVFGGANWEGDMGLELFRSFPFIDYVIQGEADHSFPDLVETLAAGHSPEFIPGLLMRDDEGEVIGNKSAIPVKDMDSVAIPDFSDYFGMLQETGAAAQVRPTLLMETSRGCWWGAQSHCTFCGLNGNGMAFRSKSATRIIEELNYLETRWQVHDVSMVDNIMDMQFFKTLLPQLAAQGKHRRIFYEIKANLSRQQVRQLHDAGIRNIQPGIESLSTHVLSLMRKGTDSLRNIQLLKWCREIGVSVDWNILYGFPGEREQDYRSTLELFGAIRHLQAPSGHGPIRLDRFSPYHSNPSSFGISHVRPMAVFNYLYPFEPERLERMVGYFDFDYDEAGQPPNPRELVNAIHRWRHDEGRYELRADDDGQVLTITDTRLSPAGQYFQLAGFDRLIYLLCDRISSVSNIHRRLLRLYPDSDFEMDDIQQLLDWLQQHTLIVREKDHVLALATYSAFPETIIAATEAPSVKKGIESSITARRLPPAEYRFPLQHLTIDREMR